MSGLGLRGLLAVSSQGVRPVGMVMGAGVYQIFRPVGCTGAGMAPSAEPVIYPDYEGALRQAWRDVIGRLRDETVAADAHGVLGVGVTQTWTGSGPQMFELRLAGTAVRVVGQPITERPFLSTLAMPEFLKLLMGGWVPCGIVWGVTAVHVHGWAANPMGQGASFCNAEMGAPTAGVILARSRLEQEARETLAETGGTGAVEVTIDLARLPQSCGGSNQGVLIDGRVLGTAVVRYRSPMMATSPIRNLSHEERHD